MDDVINVAYFDVTEAKSEKNPTVYENFTYDNETDGGVLQKFSDIGSKIKDIKTDINDLNADYKSITTKYEAFSNFETTMTNIINTMTTRIDNISTCYHSILDTAQQAVNEHVATDKTLIDDLDQIRALLEGKTGLEAGLKNPGVTSPYNLTQEQLDKMPAAEKEKYLKEKEAYEKDLEFKNTHGGYSEEAWNHLPDTAKQDILRNQEANKGGKIDNQTETQVDDKYSMSDDLDKIADDVIAGKYGNGDDRFAELEKQGYNLRDQYDADGNLISRGIQDIVNEKLNGTYDPSKTQTQTATSSSSQPTQEDIVNQNQSISNGTNQSSGSGSNQPTQDELVAQNQNISNGSNKPTQDDIVAQNQNLSNGSNNTSSDGTSNMQYPTFEVKKPESNDYAPYDFGLNSDGSVDPSKYQNELFKQYNAGDLNNGSGAGTSTGSSTGSSTGTTTGTTPSDGIYTLDEDPVK